MAVKQEFASRFAKRKDELEWLFMELYHNREGLEVLDRRDEDVPVHRGGHEQRDEEREALAGKIVGLVDAPAQQ